MLSPDQKRIVEKYKETYQKIGKIICPYFLGEFIYFNRKGFNHILRKGNKGRSFSDQIERLELLKYCEKILTAKHERVEYRITRKGSKIGRFWGFYDNFENFKIMIVVLQINQGNKHFFSIYKTLNTPRGGV
ncbi:MAG TPA: hypothetical protein VJH25_01375 [Candidatus Paceibacterota bacterium]